MMNKGSKENLRFKVESEGWGCNILIGMKFIVSLRDGLKFGTFGGTGMELLIRKPRATKSSSRGSEEPLEAEPVQILQEDENELRIPDEGEIVEIPSDKEDQDEKKTDLKYDYKNCVVLGKGVNIEVLKIPKFT